ncbi:MAG: D-alanyl-D-alanine carboxypeptidase family protein [Candidatus Taylorbacteria bacterium]|nr:D-alanyl-D-alanine carboxypeptidase family protein [Candidatus Taylorbacteria bacterium]
MTLNLDKFKKEGDVKIAVTAILLIAIIIGYGEYRRSELVTRIDGNDRKTASTTVEFESRIKSLEAGVAGVKNDNKNLSAVLDIKTSTYEAQIGNIAGTVGSLDKLSKTDPQLLRKYSKVYFLNEHYTPSALSPIDPPYLFNKEAKIQFHANAYPYLLKLFQAAQNDKVNIQIISAYRSFNTQSTLKKNYKFIYGAGTANQFSADQGYSEHQLGTALDFTTPEISSSFEGFENSTAYAWLINNAHKYGFIISYAKSNTYYEFEPWHWRFVGVDLAQRIQRDGTHFYNLDQREIDKYLLLIFN